MLVVPLVPGGATCAQIVYKDYCDVSVAVASPKGLVVPVLRNTESMSFKVLPSSSSTLFLSFL